APAPHPGPQRALVSFARSRVRAFPRSRVPPVRAFSRSRVRRHWTLARLSSRSPVELWAGNRETASKHARTRERGNARTGGTRERANDRVDLPPFWRGVLQVH